MKTVYISIVAPDQMEQHASIQDPVDPKDRIANALAYFGFKEEDVTWLHQDIILLLTGVTATLYSGYIKNTTKVITIIS